MTVVTYKRTFTKINEFGPVDYGTEPNYIKYEGVYCFGGVRGKKTGEYNISSNVYLLQVGIKNQLPRWKELNCTGKPPEERFHHGMVYYPKGNFLTVFGGRRFVNPSDESKVTLLSEFVN